MVFVRGADGFRFGMIFMLCGSITYVLVGILRVKKLRSDCRMKSEGNRGWSANFSAVYNGDTDTLLCYWSRFTSMGELSSERGYTSKRLFLSRRSEVGTVTRTLDRLDLPRQGMTL